MADTQAVRVARDFGPAILPRHTPVKYSEMDGNDVMPPNSSQHTRLTYEDFLLFPDDGLRHELIDGEHYVTLSPNLRHQELVGRLFLALGSFLEHRPDRGRVFLSPFDVVFSFHDVVEPDLVFVAPDQLDILTDKNIRGTPALVVEILSPSTCKRDKGIKRQLYERSGVREYWLGDPERSMITIYRRATDSTFPRAAELTMVADDTLETPAAAGVFSGTSTSVPVRLGR